MGNISKKKNFSRPFLKCAKLETLVEVDKKGSAFGMMQEKKKSMMMLIMLDGF